MRSFAATTAARGAAVGAALVTVLVATARLAAAQPAPASPPASGNATAAAAKRASAKDHYAKGESSAALADLADAYHLDPQPDLLYAMAHIEVELGDCAGAVAHLDSFLATNPSAKAREAAVNARAECAAKLGLSATTGAATTGAGDHGATGAGDHGGTGATTGAGDHGATGAGDHGGTGATSGTGAGDHGAADKLPPPPVEPAPAPRPFYKDGLGDGLALGAVVAGLAGGGLYLLAVKDNDDAAHAASLQSYLDQVDHAHSMRTYAIIAGSVGGALAVGAVIRWATHGGGSERPGADRVDVGVAPTGDGWGVAAFGRF